MPTRMGGTPRLSLSFGSSHLLGVFRIIHIFQADNGPGKIKAIPTAEILQKGNDPFYKSVAAQVIVMVGILPVRQVRPVGGKSVRPKLEIQGAQQAAQVVHPAMCITASSKRNSSQNSFG